MTPHRRPYRKLIALTCAGAFFSNGCGRLAPPPVDPKPEAAAPAPQAAAPAAKAAPDPNADLYGIQGGEEVLAADKAPKGAPLRARKEDTFFKLSNARVEPVGKRPFPTLVVEWERVHDGSYAGQTLVVRADDGRDRSFLLIGPFSDRAGKLEINLGIAPPGSPGFPKDAELYFTRQEARYGGDFHPNFKVSNSVVMGTTRFPTTLARNWTADEAAKLRQPPPAGPKPNSHPEVGEDSEFVGDTTGGGKFRYAESGRPVIGFDWYAGEWDKEPCLSRLVPVYETKQPQEGTQRLLARPGYAVGGLNVRTKRYVNAAQVVFMKLGPDGKLDPKDRYTGPWLGHEKVGTKEVKLGGDGRLVIGVNCQQGAILNAVTLVTERPEGK